MDYISHAIGGIVLSSGAIYLSRKVNVEPNVILVVGAATLGALLPDIDHPKSFIGNKVPIIPDILYSTIGHRTLTHSLIFAFVVGVVGMIFSLWIGLGLTLGIISHIALDMIGPHGVAFLYPFNKKRVKIK